MHTVPVFPKRVYLFHNPEFTRRLLLQSSESLLDLLIQLVEFACDILLALCVGRFELHLRKLKGDISGAVSDLRGMSAICPFLHILFETDWKEHKKRKEKGMGRNGREEESRGEKEGVEE